MLLAHRDRQECADLAVQGPGIYVQAHKPNILAAFDAHAVIRLMQALERDLKLCSGDKLRADQVRQDFALFDGQVVIVHVCPLSEEKYYSTCRAARVVMIKIKRADALRRSIGSMTNDAYQYDEQTPEKVLVTARCGSEPGIWSHMLDIQLGIGNGH